MAYVMQILGFEFEKTIVQVQLHCLKLRCKQEDTLFKVSTRQLLIHTLTVVFAIESIALPTQAGVMNYPKSQNSGTQQPSTSSSGIVNNATDFRKINDTLGRKYFESSKTGFNNLNPAIKDIMSVPSQIIAENAPRFEGRKELDLDPYFMRSGQWVPAERKVSDFLVKPLGAGVEIFVPGASNKLVLNIPLRPIWANDEILLFAVAKTSNIFAEKIGEKETVGESFFAVEVPRLKVMAQAKEPVPFFSLPIQGSNWRENTKAMYFVQGDLLALMNEEEKVLYWMDDIREVLAAERALLDLAVMMSVMDPRQAALMKDPSYRVLPAPGSTAAFGTVFTGLNLNRPGWNFFKSPPEKFAEVAQLEKNGSGHSSFSFLKLIATKAISQAEAQSVSGDPVHDALMNAAFFVGMISTVAVISAFVLKYKPEKNPIKKKLDEIWKKRAEFDSSLAKQEGRSVKDYFHIFGSFTTSIAQFPLISPGLGSRFAVDRWIPYWGSAKHKLLARVMHFTTLPGLRHFGDLTVTAKPTILGSGYAGTIGVGIGYLMSFHALPAFAHYVGPLLGTTLNLALNQAFNADNAAVNALLITNLLVGASIGVLRGAADFTMDAKSREIERISSKVDVVLRDQGKNPHDPKINSQREEMINKEFDIALVKLGLPTSFEKLFDAMSLYQAIAESRGYTAAVAEREKNLNPMKYGPDREAYPNLENLKGDSFTMISRRGLLPWILKRTQQQAQMWHETSPSETTRNALALANEAVNDSDRLLSSIQVAANHIYEVVKAAESGEDTLRNLYNKEKLAQVKAEIEAVSQKAVKFRQLLTLSMYEGSIEYTGRYLPRDWIEKYGANGANLFVLLARKSEASFLDEEGNRNLSARREDVLTYLDKAERKAFEEIKKLPELAGLTDQKIRSIPEVQSELAIRASLITAELGQQNRADEAAKKFKPQNSWYENWLHRRAIKKTQARMFQYNREQRDLGNVISPEQEKKTLRDIYVSEISQNIGLHIQDLAANKARLSRPTGEVPWYPVNNAISREEFAELVRSGESMMSFEEYQKLSARVNDSEAAARHITPNQAYQILLNEVRQGAEGDLKTAMSSKNMQTYLSKLSPTEREYFEARMYASAFISQYRNATTGQPLLSPVDPAQPGFTQRARQWLANRTVKDLETLSELENLRPDPWEKSLLRFRRAVVSSVSSKANRGLRFVDGFFGDSSVERSLMGVLARRVPLLEDVVSANIRNLYLMPVGLSVSWAWSHHVLRTGIDYAFWTTGFIFQGLTIIAPSQWLYRNYRLQGFMPFANIKNYLANDVYAMIVTFPSTIVGILMLHQVHEILNDGIAGPVGKAMASVSVPEGLSWLMAGALAWVGGKYFEEWKAKSAINRIKLFGKKSEVNVAAKSANALTPESQQSVSGPLMCSVVFGRFAISAIGTK